MLLYRKSCCLASPSCWNIFIILISVYLLASSLNTVFLSFLKVFCSFISGSCLEFFCLLFVCFGYQFLLVEKSRHTPAVSHSFVWQRVIWQTEKTDSGNRKDWNPFYSLYGPATDCTAAITVRYNSPLLKVNSPADGTLCILHKKPVNELLHLFVFPTDDF